MSERQLHKHAVIRLQRLVDDCARFVPFYRRHWAGLDVSRMRFPRDLEYLPVVRKADLLAQPLEQRCDERLLGRCVSSDCTSGSTGEPFEVRMDRGTLARRRWRFLKALLAAGYRPGERLMLITNPPYPRGARLAQWFYVDLRDGEEAVFAAYLRLQPAVLYGPLSSLLLLARRLAEGAAMHRPRVVISTAEELRPPQRETLQRAFGPNIADFYGMTETGLIAFATPRSAGYRVPTNDLYLEYVGVGRTPLEQLLVTDLAGGLMPLIRFDTGDLIHRDRARPGVPIVRFGGRKVDCLKLQNRWIAPYEITLALDRIPGIARYAIEQDADSTIHLYLMPVAGTTEVVDAARAVLIGICGEAMQLDVQLRAMAPALPGQKQRYVHSRAAV